MTGRYGRAGHSMVIPSMVMQHPAWSNQSSHTRATHLALGDLGPGIYDVYGDCDGKGLRMEQEACMSEEHAHCKA